MALISGYLNKIQVTLCTDTHTLSDYNIEPKNKYRTTRLQAKNEDAEKMLKALENYPEEIGVLGEYRGDKCGENFMVVTAAGPILDIEQFLMTRV